METCGVVMITGAFILLPLQGAVVFGAGISKALP